MRASRWLVAALFVAATVVVVEAQQPRQGGGGRGFSVGGQVLTNADLQDDLKLTDAQKERLKAAAEKQKAMTAKVNDALKDAFKGGGDKEKNKELFADAQKLREDNAKLVDETLTAEQKARIKQIDRQLAGVRAFTNDEMVADLKLTDAQKTKVKGIVDEYAKDSAGLGGFGGKGGFDKEKAAEAQKKREKLTKGAMADIDEVLNDEQRKTWKDLTGPAIDRSKFQFGGGFGGGFGNRGKTQKKD